jgi:Phage integrase family
MGNRGDAGWWSGLARDRSRHWFSVATAEHDEVGLAGPCQLQREAAASGPLAVPGSGAVFPGSPLKGDEMRALRKLARETGNAEFVFVSERGSPFTAAGFGKMVARAGHEAGFEFGVHPHMLRHACGYKLANDGHDTRSLQAYLGHRNIQHTVRYSEMSATRFRDFWRD